jgi:hypothetical protein
LKNQNKDFIFHNCTEAFQLDLDYPLLKDFFAEVLKLKNFVNLFDNTYHLVNKRAGIIPYEGIAAMHNGHHMAEGNLEYSRFLIEQFNKLYSK